MKMGVRIANLMAVMVVLAVAGCKSTPPDAASVTTSGDMTSSTNAAPVTGVDGMQAGAATPGSEQDLVVNVGDRVFFDVDKYDLSAEARTTIEKQAQWLKTYPNVNIMVEGHADERGTREYNLALGEKRAMAERNYLIAMGVDAKRIQTISYGKERPAVLGSDESSWAQNRRAVVVVQ
jgi:peptidoglycan-associated lipoprotein